MAITNNSKGVRGFNVRTGPDDRDGNVPHYTHLLKPGETLDDAELADPGNPVYRGWADCGDIDFGGALPSAEETKTTRRGRPPKVVEQPSET